MNNLFFVSVATSILSGASLSADAQKNIHFTNEVSNTLTTETPSYAMAAANHAKISTGFYKATNSAETELCSSLQFKYSQLMDREVETITNFSLYNFIDDWFGTRYRYGGSTKKGIDCSSFTGKLMKDVFSVELPRTAREQYKATIKITEEEMAEGDLVFFNTRGGVSHVGLFLGNGYFVHASSSNGVTISRLDEPYFKHRFLGAGRIPANQVDLDYTGLLL